MRMIAAALVILVGSATARGREVAGATVPDTVRVDERTLVLNGAGVRTRFLFKVYAMGLYLEHPSTDAGAILAADEPRRAELHLLRSLTADEIADAIGTAFERNAGAAMPQLHDRLERLKSMFPATEPGETIALTYTPGTGTLVTVKGRSAGTIPGKDFADALFAVWIGANPVDASLKQALLAGR